MSKPVEATGSQDNFQLGLLFAIGAAVTFGLSGPFAKSLMEAGGRQPRR